MVSAGSAADGRGNERVSEESAADGRGYERVSAGWLPRCCETSGSVQGRRPTGEEVRG